MSALTEYNPLSLKNLVASLPFDVLRRNLAHYDEPRQCMMLEIFKEPLIKLWNRKDL